MSAEAWAAWKRFSRVMDEVAQRGTVLRQGPKANRHQRRKAGALRRLELRAAARLAERAEREKVLAVLDLGALA